MREQTPRYSSPKHGPTNQTGTSQRVEGPTLNASEPHADLDIVEAIGQDLELNLWKRAASHFLGQGLEQGPPNFDPAKLVRRNLGRAAAQEKVEEALALEPLRSVTDALLSLEDVEEPPTHWKMKCPAQMLRRVNWAREQLAFVMLRQPVTRTLEV